jgi:hypothetical protein
VSDLHWLVHQGHVIEFATGVLETAKKPIVRPQRPATPKAANEPASATSETAQAESEAQVTGEGSMAEHVEAATQDSPAPNADQVPAGQPSEHEVPAAAGHDSGVQPSS